MGKEKKSGFGKFLVGLGVGAGIGMLFAPKSGKETREEFLSELKENLLKCFRDEKTYSFLKDDTRWKELIK